MTATAVETETQPYCELVGDEIYIPANKVLATAYNLENETNYPYYLVLEESANPSPSSNIKINFADCLKSDKLYTVGTCEYKLFKGSRFSNSGYERVTYNEGAYYQKIRIKVSDFYNAGGRQYYENGQVYDETKYYFEDDGDFYFYHHINGDFTFDFTNVKGKQESGIHVRNGAAVSAVKPDENGMIEFYVKKQIANSPYLAGNVTEWIESGTFSSSLGDKLRLSVGDVDFSKKIDVTDTTVTQKYCAGLAKFTEAQKFFADANCDGVVNVKDATTIQKHCVKK